MKKGFVSTAVIRRLPRYYRFLSDLLKSGVIKISSGELGGRMGITPSQIRQDFNCFGDFGQQGYGYHIESLKREIAAILGIDMVKDAVIVGAGNLGRALANHVYFEKRGFKLTGIFDNSPDLIGREIGGLEVKNISELDAFVKENKPVIAILTLPKTETHAMVERLTALGVKGFWNFSHADNMRIPGVFFEDVHLEDSLMTLSYRISNMDQQEI